MMIMVSGPFGADSERERGEQLDALNRAAVEVLRKGHVPAVGMHAARPVVEAAAVEDENEASMRISLALAERCDAVLVLGSSSGADRERRAVERHGGSGEIPG